MKLDPSSWFGVSDQLFLVSARHVLLSLFMCSKQVAVNAAHACVADALQGAGHLGHGAAIVPWHYSCYRMKLWSMTFQSDSNTPVQNLL
eukprot:360138-Amphidinium_carterae.2